MDKWPKMFFSMVPHILCVLEFRYLDNLEFPSTKEVG